MNHKFVKQEMPVGDKYIHESCPCGAVRRRYATGAVAYRQPNGSFYASPTPPHRPVPGPIKAADLKAFIATDKIPPPMPSKIVTAGMSSLLKNAYDIINQVYGEMVTAGLHTPGRQMIGKLLYSDEYQETIKKLENQ